MKKPIAQYPIDALVQRRLDALENLVDTEYEGSAKVFEVRTELHKSVAEQTWKIIGAGAALVTAVYFIVKNVQ